MLSSKIFDCASATHLLKWITTCLFISSCSASINDVFTVKKGIDKGGCDNYSGNLTVWFSEIQDLLQAGIQAFDDAFDVEINDAVALATLDGYFGLRPSSSDNERAGVKKYLQQTSDFWAGTHQLIADGITSKPWLFCNSDWEQPVKRTDFTYRVVAESEAAGSEIVETFKSDNGDNQAVILTGVAIQDVYKDMLFDEGDPPRPNELIPYWSRDLEEYTFQPVYGDDPLKSTFCGLDTSDDVDQNLAGTDDETIPASVTLCPLSFTAEQGKRTLKFTEPEIGNPVTKYIPRSATLLHESIHLVFGKIDTPDASYDLDEVKLAIIHRNTIPLTTSFADPNGNNEKSPKNYDEKSNIELVRMNPETFVWFCVSYWYYLQDPDPKAVAVDFRYTFPAGIAQWVSIDV
ncbi:3441ec81-c2e3-4cf5-89b8-bd02fda31f63 [Sclerotinia trifoliorum]|uniref:3441ec81-c2e3-4cf5-89b8-bd02fda31f63 n=1 Tax=Sclerotinia trifoliorum TaxID=28548 RepID=A0A8H2VMB2_9HELO|nr:3441ec81-c2e3-4cf5-89b8-bd02fda31f63 [Sclerotinia trifoliorum]